MALIASENPRLTNWLKREMWAEQGYCRLAVVANEAAATTYKTGTVLGKVTASGKYVQYDNAATTGEEVAAGVVIEEAELEAGVDKTVLVLVKGPAIAADGGLVFKDGTVQGDKDAAYADLEAAGINVDKQL